MAGVGALFGIIGTVASYAYHRDNEALKEKAQTGINQADTALAKCHALGTEIANERTERVRLEGEIKAMLRESQAREDMRERMITRDGFDEQMRQQQAINEAQLEMLNAIARKTGSIHAMAAVRPPLLPRSEPSDPPPPEVTRSGRTIPRR